MQIQNQENSKTLKKKMPLPKQETLGLVHEDHGESQSTKTIEVAPAPGEENAP